LNEELQRLRFASVAEAVTLAVLVSVAVPLKHLAGWEPGVKFMGPLHGFAFLFYIWCLAQAVAAGDWTSREIARLILVAFVPFAGFTTIRLIRRKAMDSR
jgi:integral membrane protein